jgi:endoplasmic reticulum-Golgi intermediate compartment protein 3
VRLRDRRWKLTFVRHADDAQHLDPNYCGECYGAPAPEDAKKAGCCNTCDEVRDAYAAISWSFGRGENVEQCTREHYAERLEAQRKEGCRLEGSIRVNKVAGNFHFAPGKSFSNGNLHVHDLENYFKDGSDHSFTHKIHQLRFGPPLPPKVIQAIGSGGNTGSEWTNHHVNPLDGSEQHTFENKFNYMYFVKVVSTAYLPLGWEKHKGKSIETGAHAFPHEWIGLGMLGHGELGSIETHQYSVTSHARNVGGGDDAEKGHKERIHSKGGIPGVFFSYVSPLISCD